MESDQDSYAKAFGLRLSTFAGFFSMAPATTLNDKHSVFLLRSLDRVVKSSGGGENMARRLFEQLPSILAAGRSCSRDSHSDRHSSRPIDTYFRHLLDSALPCLAVVAILLGSLLIACGGGSSTPKTVPVVVTSVTVSGTATAVATGGTVTLTATVNGTGSPSQSVTWACTGGTVNASTGVYTAPATAGNYTCTATSVADTTMSSSPFAVTVASVSVSAPITTVAVNGTLTFTATVAPSTESQTVTWACGSGKITSAGVYTAPATAGSDTCTATSTAVTSAMATTPTITVTSAAVQKPTFTSTPSTTLAVGATYTYAITTTPTGATLAPTTLPAGATLTGSTVSWTPTAAELLMPSNFTVTATNAGGSTAQSWTVTPLRNVTVTYGDNFWNAGPGSPAVGPLESVAVLGAIVPGSATTCTSGGYTFNLCASTLTSSTGTYIIDNVPAGYYWLANGPTERYWTNVSSFDGSTDFIGQLLEADAAAQTVTITALPLLATASPNVSPNDVIWIGSPNTTAWWAPQGPVGGTPLPPTLTPMTYTGTIALGTLPAINSGGGNPDPSWILQFTPRSITGGAGTVGYAGMSIAADSSLGTGFTYATPIGATDALTDSTSATLSFATKGWSSLIPGTYTLSGGTTTPGMVYFGTYLASLPYTTAPLSAIGGGYPSCSSSTLVSNTVPCTEAPGLVGWPPYTSYAPDPALLSTPHQQNTREAATDASPLFMAYAALDSSTCSTSLPSSLCTPPDSDTVTMPVDNAFASTGWPMVLSSQVEIQTKLGYTSNFSTISTSQFSVSSLGSAITDQPLVSTVAAPTITWPGNTTPVGMYKFASPAPGMTLSWGAATLNSAVSGAAVITGYHVMVYAAPSGSGSWGTALVDLYTTNLSLTVPTLKLAAGTYVFVIEAKADAEANLLSAPWHSKFPRGTAQVVSAPMTVTAAW